MLKKEPVLVFLGGLAAVVAAGLAAATGLGWLPWTGQQCALVVTFTTACTALAAAVIRATVDAPATVAAKVADALATPTYRTEIPWPADGTLSPPVESTGTEGGR